MKEFGKIIAITLLTSLCTSAANEIIPWVKKKLKKKKEPVQIVIYGNGHDVIVEDGALDE